ncbi:MAG: hypothetical protein ACK40R_01335 [Thermomonas sp.]
MNISSISDISTPSRGSLAGERRKAPRHPNEVETRLQRVGEREFGIGYGRSSGYVRVRSYVSSQPVLFRCR